MKYSRPHNSSGANLSQPPAQICLIPESAPSTSKPGASSQRRVHQGLNPVIIPLPANCTVSDPHHLESGMLFNFDL